MNTLIFILIAASCFAIAFMTNGGTGVFALFLCFISFALGANIYADIVRDKARNNELLEISKKYYEVKYVKDKAE